MSTDKRWGTRGRVPAQLQFPDYASHHEGMQLSWPLRTLFILLEVFGPLSIRCTCISPDLSLKVALSVKALHLNHLS